jgi:hypothetical protein
MKLENHVYFVIFLIILIIVICWIFRLFKKGLFDMNDTEYDPSEIDTTKYEEE